MIDRIEELIRDETAGDPITGLKWTRRTTQKIADELSAFDIKVCRVTVGKILEQMNYSLKTNRKTISNGGKRTTKEEGKNRDDQFEYIKKMLEKHRRMNTPSISTDTKKKELVGNFKNPGTRYKRGADLTNDHDFLTYALGKAALYGVYDLERNEGFVSIGMFLRNGALTTLGDTPEFAVESIERWWTGEGL